MIAESVAAALPFLPQPQWLALGSFRGDCPRSPPVLRHDGEKDLPLRFGCV
ncbi:hypothetical protein [Mesorhizobium sp. 131-3-5]|uniref:hypothetical protein n=1 Tax=Mesorhizobium sp. 131-3-5 TaxID=2744520 RepID=UPI00406C377A